MSYFETWNKKIEDSSDQEKYTAYVQHYYELEQEAYNRILSAFPDNKSLTEGTASELAAALGFGADNMDIFTGFVDGVNPSLAAEQKPEDIDNDTPILLAIDYEKLYLNMHDAKADWLYNLASWKNVLTKEKMSDITKEFRTSKIVHVEKIGRNDPCPCGSGKKYKQCCMNKN